MVSDIDTGPVRGGRPDAARVCAAARRLGRIGDLSPREREVLRHAAFGDADREIAGRMRVAHRTVRYYFSMLFRKLDARGRVDVALTGLLAHVAGCEECLLAISSFREPGPPGREPSGPAEPPGHVDFDSTRPGS